MSFKIYKHNFFDGSIVGDILTDPGVTRNHLKGIACLARESICCDKRDLGIEFSLLCHGPGGASVDSDKSELRVHSTNNGFGNIFFILGAGLLILSGSESKEASSNKASHCLVVLCLKVLIYNFIGGYNEYF